MSGLKGTREFVLRADNGGDPLIGFRQRHPDELTSPALIITLHPFTTDYAGPVSLDVCADAVEDLHALTGQILAGRAPKTRCGFTWARGAEEWECALDDGHAAPLGNAVFHVSGEGEPYEEPPF